MALDKCPQCGYTDKITVSKFSTVMNHYENENGKRIAANTDQESFSNEQGLFIKIDPATNKPVKPFKAAAPTTAPITPTK